MLKFEDQILTPPPIPEFLSSENSRRLWLFLVSARGFRGKFRENRGQTGNISPKRDMLQIRHFGKGAEKASYGETIVQKGASEESVSSLPP